jgi:hypothetical protein
LYPSDRACASPYWRSPESAGGSGGERDYEPTSQINSGTRPVMAR